MSADKEVVLEFELRQRHSWIATSDEWAQFCASLRLPTGIDAESIEEVGEWLSGSGWEAEEALHELAQAKNTWVDNGRAEVDDLTIQDAEVQS